MSQSNVPGLVAMSTALALFLALVAVAWNEASIKESQIPKPVTATTSVSASRTR